MSLPLRLLTTVAELDAALAASDSRAILIYKHSLTCGTSAIAHEEIDEIAELIESDALPVDVFVVRVQTARPVSDAIETRLRVRHESPQALLISRGQVIWRASHFRVTATAVAAALRQHVPQPQLAR